MRRGFTLIELLVVIAVIALLLSIMLPSYFSILERTDRNICQNNHHHLITACMAYAAEWDTYLPFCNSASAERGGWVGPGWLYDYDANGRQHSSYGPEDREHGVLWAHMGDESLYRCPAEDPPYSAANTITSYLMNRSVVYGAGPDQTNWRCWRTTDIIAFVGADAILFWEAADSDWNDGCSYPWQDLTRRHGDGATVGCVAGHTDWVTHEEYEAQQQSENRPGRLYCNPGDPADGG